MNNYYNLLLIIRWSKPDYWAGGSHYTNFNQKFITERSFFYTMNEFIFFNKILKELIKFYNK